MFHQPINSFMENNTAQDAGRGLVNCLEIPPDSDFWRRVYNMAGGPSCRTTYYDLLKKMLGMNGVRLEHVTERNWFALRNFHMQYYEDSHILNTYIHNWNHSMEDFYQMFANSRPFYLKLVAWLCKRSSRIQRKVEAATYKRMKALAVDTKNSTVYWYNNRNNMRISAFYKDYETFESIPDWGIDIPELDSKKIQWKRLNHGYNESKSKLDLEDLKDSASFRGGVCLSEEWNGNMYASVSWKCADGHVFMLKPYTVLKAGHWCPKCAPPPWRYDEIARKNPFFAQVWYPNHGETEDNYYPADCFKDIVE